MDGVDVGAEVVPSELAQLRLCLAQPGAEGLQVRDELLPLLQALGTVSATQGLGLEQLPALDPTWRAGGREGGRGRVFSSCFNFIVYTSFTLTDKYVRLHVVCIHTRLCVCVCIYSYSRVCVHADQYVLVCVFGSVWETDQGSESLCR